jgi:DeoR family transcriptional regulator, fructose operon transcriptional repressor
MLADQRIERILTLLETHGFRTNNLLASDLGVSEMTVRRDLASLARDGKVKRVHGGARIVRRPESAQTQTRSALNATEKHAIAEAAADRVGDGETIFLDAGSTMLELAIVLKRRSFKNLRVVTNAVSIAAALIGDEITTVQLGGELYRNTGAVTGQSALRFLESSRFDRCFLAASAANFEFGISDKHLPEIDVKRAAIGHSSWVALLMDASKWESQAMLRVAALRDIHCFITDARLNSEAREALRNRGLEVVIANE